LDANAIKRAAEVVEAIRRGNSVSGDEGMEAWIEAMESSEYPLAWLIETSIQIRIQRPGYSL
jgi:hypothetical protein